MRGAGNNLLKVDLESSDRKRKNTSVLNQKSDKILSSNQKPWRLARRDGKGADGERRTVLGRARREVTAEGGSEGGGPECGKLLFSPGASALWKFWGGRAH